MAALSNNLQRCMNELREVGNNKQTLQHIAEHLVTIASGEEIVGVANAIANVSLRAPFLGSVTTLFLKNNDIQNANAVASQISDPTVQAEMLKRVRRAATAAAGLL